MKLPRVIDEVEIRVLGCRRKKTRPGQRCATWHPDCVVRRTTSVAEKQGVGACFSDMDHAKQLMAPKGGPHKDLSVVGVACVWMLAGGIRSAEAAGIPRQGVLLDCCGFEHWSDDSFTIGAAAEKVKQILKAKRGDP